MFQLCNIPLKYKSGSYELSEWEEDTEEGFAIDYQEAGEIVTYKIPDYEYGRSITLYGIPKEDMEKSIKAFYDKKGFLKKITAVIKGREVLLYIHYENAEEAKQEVEKIAIENADRMIEEICQCKEAVSRLFIEYFDDGEYIDIHAKIGTESEKNALEQKYPDYNNIADSCGDYKSEIIKGDNDKLKIRIFCADDEEMDYLRFAVDKTAERIRQNAVSRLNQAADFKILCIEYD